MLMGDILVTLQRWHAAPAAAASAVDRIQPQVSLMNGRIYHTVHVLMYIHTAIKAYKPSCKLTRLNVYFPKFLLVNVKRSIIMKNRVTFLFDVYKLQCLKYKKLNYRLESGVSVVLTSHHTLGNLFLLEFRCTLRVAYLADLHGLQEEHPDLI